MKKFYVLKYVLSACLLLSSILVFSNTGKISGKEATKSSSLSKKATTHKNSLTNTGEKFAIGDPDPPVPTSIRIIPQNVNLLTALPANLKILSINNSLIDYNDQSAIFNQIAASAGKTATWVKQTRLGKSLRYHYEEGDGVTAEGPSAKLTVRSQPWTHIILQEQSDKPLTNPTDFLASVKLWQDYIKNYCPNPNAKIIIAMNWAYVDAANFTGTTETIYGTYLQIAKELGLTVAPIGNAYEKIRQTDGETAKNSLFSDDRHPTLLASYLAACTEYAVIFDSFPINISYYPNTISAPDARRMQNYAWNVYTEHEDIVNDVKGTIRFNYEVLDQFNQPITGITGVSWNVNQGGSIDNNGIFTRSGTNETVATVTAQYGAISTSATINLVKAVTGMPQQPAVEISSTNNYSQSFDAIGNGAVTTLPTGWKVEKNTSTPRVVGSYSTSSNVTEQIGGNGIAGNTPNGIYNFGAGIANEAADRAIGGISTGVAGGTRGINVYLKTKNTGTTNIHALDISYDVEKYRQGNNAAGFTVQLYYSVNGETWISAGNDFRTFFAADGSTAGYPTAPDVSRNISATLQQELAPGEVLYLAWNYSVDSGTDAQGAQALGIDNVSIGASLSPPIINYASISSTTGYNQNFDTVQGSTVANSQTLPLGFKIDRIFSSPRVLGSFNSASTATDYFAGISMAANAANGTYNFGAGTTSAAAASATDRAIGGISTGIVGGTRGINIYLKLKNTGTADINTLDINYDIEKYRQGANGAGFTIQLYYSRDGETWVSAGNNFRAFFAADGSTLGYSSATPGATRNISANLNQELTAGSTLYLAWNYSVDSGTDAQGAQALAIDNLSIQGKLTLPLKITSFTTQLTGLQNKQTVVRWTTAQEVNTNQFYIERSADGLIFNNIGNIPAKNTSGINNYSFTDENPLQGTSYYRLKEVDKDGTSTYSDIRAVKNAEALTVYPNPITDYLNINVPAYLQGGTIKIHNTLGKTIFTKSNAVAKEYISFANFSDGVYVLEITNGNDIKTFKLLKDTPNQ